MSPISCGSGGGTSVAPGSSGRFTVGTQRVPFAQADQYCRTNAQTLASIHSAAEQQQAAAVCQSMDPGESYGCWIGFEDSGSEGGFVWSDGSNVDFVNFSPGEPNDAFGDWDNTNSGYTETQARGAGEDVVAMSFRGTRRGRWNDETASPDMSGFSWGMNFPLCQSQVPPSDHTKLRVWGVGATTSLNIRICVDADDYREPAPPFFPKSPDQNRCLCSVYFQDDRLWLQYGGNWGAAGNADLCPEDYNGKAYVSEQEWDISGLQACTPGSTCPVSKVFTDTRFMVPQG